MKTPVIDSIRMAANDGISPELEKITRNTSDRERPELIALGKLLESLTLDTKTINEIMHLGIDLSAAGAESGFRQGFRVAAWLMLEILGAPEDPEEEGGA